LGVGSVTKDGTKGQLFIRDRKIIESVIIPIFDKYTLLTSKYFDYIIFKKALAILNNVNLNKTAKDLELLRLKNSKVPTNYLSPVLINASLPLDSINSLNNVMSKS
jgi:hypothetical protein